MYFARTSGTEEGQSFACACQGPMHFVLASKRSCSTVLCIHFGASSAWPPASSRGRGFMLPILAPAEFSGAVEMQA